MRFGAVVLSIFVLNSALGQSVPPPGPFQEISAGPSPSWGVPDPCIDCDALYASGCGTDLWKIDPDTGDSILIGQMPVTMFDVAISSDGRLFGMGGGSLWEISACDASAVPVGFIGGNGLTGDIATTDLFAQGPPLQRIETTGTFPVTDVGGQVGQDPPEWCGFSSGDLALNPADGLLYSVLAYCPDCNIDDRVVKIDPATGEVVEELGCLPGPLTVIIDQVFGLAFDSQGRLWAARGEPRAELMQVDPVTGFASLNLSVSGGFSCAYGLASCPLGLAPSGPACDIKPGSDPNSINTRSNGVIPVAILGSSTFDVNDIDPSTVTFGPDGATPAHKVGIHYDDVDQDGFLDALFHFRTRETGIREGDEEACIAWMSFAGDSFTCCDSVRTVPVQGHPRGARPAMGVCGGLTAPPGPMDLIGLLLPWVALLVIARGILSRDVRARGI